MGNDGRARLGAMIAGLLLMAMILVGCGKREKIDNTLSMARVATITADANYSAIIKAQADDMRALLRQNYEAVHQKAVSAEITRGKIAGTPEALEIAVSNVQALERVKLQKYLEFEAYFESIKQKVDEARKDTNSILLILDNAKEYLKQQQDKSAAISSLVDTGGGLIQSYLDSTNKKKATTGTVPSVP